MGLEVFWGFKSLLKENSVVVFDGASPAVTLKKCKSLKQVVPKKVPTEDGAGASSTPGPSLILAYAPCISQGFPMAESIQHCQMAVDSGP